MKFKQFQIDYARSDERKWVAYLDNEPVERDLTYNEVCGMMKRELDKAFDEGLIEDKGVAYDLIGDSPAFNEYMDFLEGVVE